jgi:peptidoglycan/LPS O-acetylase OafA/YrhL
MISGAGTYYALGKRSSAQYISERTKRLLIPLVVGIFTLVPVQVYIEKIDNYNSLAEFYRHMFDGVYPVGNFSWHHLWFIAYLFIISLIISPFLNFLRSTKFQKYILWLETIVTKPLAMNIILIPLLLSQIILCQFFDTETNDLIHDWASVTYYIIFFLSGFILLPVKKITEAICRQRIFYLIEVFAAGLLLFKVNNIIRSTSMAEIFSELFSIILAWSCAMAAIGFAKKYLNRQSKLRKLANEAIYPFYLLHQPVIVVTGFFVTNLNLTAFTKMVIILVVSFTVTIAIYWLMIRPFNLFRITFGMKKIEKSRNEYSKNYNLEEVVIKNKIHLSA